jgi:hypothetical protein
MSTKTKVKYKNQIRNEMMKTFGKLFSSSNESDSIEDTNKLENLISPGENVFDICNHIKKLNKTVINGNDGFDVEFEVFFIFIIRLY